MHDDALLGIYILVFVGHHVGMVAGSGEDSGHEGLLHLVHLRAVVLQEGLVPDGPHAVEIIVTVETTIGIEVLTTVILLEPCLAGKGHEAHRTTLGTVEEGGLIAFQA